LILTRRGRLVVAAMIVAALLAIAFIPPGWWL
jgi:hypothetical protein